MTTDYNSLKVPELKKLLQEKSLPVAGNKADLIARLQENDKQNAAGAAPVEDEIDWDDDEPVKAAESAKVAEPTTTETAAPAPAAPQESAAATNASAEAPAADATATDDKTAAAGEGEAAEAEAPKTDFSAHLPASTADEEARKRAERAKRFGIVPNDEEQKKEERAKKFGIENDASAVVKGLDDALPERRPKRGRGNDVAAEAGRDGGAKRQSLDRRGGPGGRNRRGDRNRPNGAAGGREAGAQQKPQQQKKTAAIDPAEKAKQEARAKRFGGGA